jgi:Dinucleotide-utilizing enzymes involved in molybdopterin and thiamine biosynthesis family 2
MQRTKNYLKNRNISVQQMKVMDADDYLCIDTRGEAAYQHGHIPEAVCWDGRYENLKKISNGKKLIVYCTYGKESIKQTEKLNLKGFEAYNLSGGYREWLLCEFGELNGEEVRRYDRQMILPQVGSEGQKKLKSARVLIVGAGGLGSPAALYLAGAGIGKIGIMDADVVTISNLQRQIIHSIKTEGMNKAESAEKALKQINDKIEIKAYPYFLNTDNIEEIIAEYDFVLDAVDNFETKFLINDACVLNKKAFCHAGILQFEGQVMTYVPGEFPCYRCIFEGVPPKGTVQNCSEAGIIGAVAGVIGSIQALEAVKYFLGAGELLVGKMLVFNGLSMKMRIVNFEKKNSNCKVCGRNKEIVSIKNYENEYKRIVCNFKC